MNKETAKAVINQITSQIFDIEVALSDDSNDIARKQGYRARVELGRLYDMVKERNDWDISKP